MLLPNVALMLVSAMSWTAHAQDTVADGASLRFFEERVRPILAARCVSCHGPDNQKSGLRLDSREAILTGGEQGPAIILDSVADSPLLKAVRHDGLQMPPDGKLADDEIAALEAWVAAAAPWPDTSRITAADATWWAFQPLASPEIPGVAGDAWSQNPIDRFVLQRMRSAGVEPAPQASEAERLRRLYFDLIGLPPAPEEIHAFLDNPDPGKWEKTIDRLLADPRYGEHWARFWLDIVRYAESDGWNKDSYRPTIWRYRDYVVDAFNADKPYPQFVREQLAGDEMPGDDPAQLTATGFLRLGIYEYNQRDARNQWNDIMNEMTDVTGDVFLGLSMSCARCHDHKFDPIPQTDYFGLRAFLEPIIWRDDIPAASDTDIAAWHEKRQPWLEATAAIRAEINALCKPYYDKKWRDTADKFPLDIQACFNMPLEDRSSWDHQMAYLVARQFDEEGQPALSAMSKEDKAKLDELNAKLAEFDAIKPPDLPAILSVTDFEGSIAPTRIPGSRNTEPVTPRFLEALSHGDEAIPDLPDLPHSSGRRTALAQWIGGPENPLTTRLMVNRIWQQHFGVGIVPSASDFGRLGQEPTHPELLEWLTRSYVENGWSAKYLHKLILTSATWQQASNHPDAERCAQLDPSESLLWRTRLRRLTAEQVRDAMLAASGELDPRRGGPSVDDEVPRRGLYVQVKRNSPDPLLHAFDAANGLTSTAQRNLTTTPTQALLMLNGDYAVGRAEKLAERLLARQWRSDAEMLDYLYLQVWGREPTKDERALAHTYIAPNLGEDATGIDPQRLADFCHILFNSNEFFYID